MAGADVSSVFSFPAMRRVVTCLRNEADHDPWRAAKPGTADYCTMIVPCMEVWYSQKYSNVPVVGKTRSND